MAPGRSCPLHYRYPSAALAREPDLRVETLYVVGGLYGNRQALATALSLAAAEQPRATLVFNGDFNWFNVDDAGFAAVNGEVLRHAAMRGNVETELASDDGAAGRGGPHPPDIPVGGFPPGSSPPSGEPPAQPRQPTAPAGFGSPVAPHCGMPQDFTVHGGEAGIIDL